MTEAQAAPRCLLVLWDIDHTLIENNGVNKETYARTFELLTGRPAEHRAETEGRTEPELMRNMLVAHGIEPGDDFPERVVEALEAATKANSSRLRERGHVLPGARDALAALRDLPGVVQSVLSGNIAPNAYTKLSLFGLADYLDLEVGGHGSDDPVRAKLVAIAQDRASAKYGMMFGRPSTVLVGDTLRDVRAGLDGGARVLAVATGSDSIDSLRGAGADVVLPDLRDTDAFVDVVREFQRQAAGDVLPSL